MKEWIRTRMCGCGECRFKPSDVVCPLKDSRDAIQLWASAPGSGATAESEEPLPVRVKEI